MSRDEERRFVLAIGLSFLILWGWILFGPKPPAPEVARKRGSDTHTVTAAGDTVAPSPETRAHSPADPEDGTSIQFPKFQHKTASFRDKTAAWSVSTKGGVLTRYSLLDYPRGAPTDTPRVSLVGSPHRTPDSGAFPLSLATSPTPHDPIAAWPFEVTEAGETFAVFTAGPELPGLPHGLVVEKRIVRVNSDRLDFEIAFRNPTETAIVVSGARLEHPPTGEARVGSLFLHFGPDLGANPAPPIYQREYIPRAVVGRPEADRPKLGPPGLFEKLLAAFGKKRPSTFNLAWAGIEIHHFAFAVRRADSVNLDARFERAEDGGIDLWILLPRIDLPPGGEERIAFESYWGPKETGRLAAFHPTFKALDGMEPRLFPSEISFARWMVRLLVILYRITGNYGYAIILLTLLVKGALFPLSQMSFKSMAKMQDLKPQMEKIQKRYKDDKQKMQREMMRLYQEAGVNPLGGCLPLLFQMPVLIGLFYALQASVRLRREPFVLWIKDLSIPDTVGYFLGVPINPVAILMIGTMFGQQWFQQKMMPAPQTEEAKQQRQMMTMMLAVMAFLFYSAPSGLTLYWTLQSVLSFLQQVLVMKGGKKEYERS